MIPLASTALIEHPWMRHASMSLRTKAVSVYPVVTWPSGRQTQECAASVVTVSDLELATAYVPDDILTTRAMLARKNCEFFLREAARLGVWVKHRRNGRKRARRITAIEWSQGS